MPSLGADMESGTLLEWRIKPGDVVKRGDIAAVVDTSKAEIEVEIFQDGTVEELLVAEGTRVPVGTVLATLRAGEERESGEVASLPPPSDAPPAARPGVAPVARRAAEQLGVDITSLQGTGPNGAITLADVQGTVGSMQAAIAVKPDEAPAPSVVADRQAAMRQAIGALMARSKREIPHYYLQREIDMSAAMAWLEDENSRREPQTRLISSVLLLAAVRRAARQMPAMNGFWTDGSFQASEEVHLGVAIAQRGGGLIAPALRDAGGKSLDELMAGLRELVARVRGGRMRASVMWDSSITVTILGDGGFDVVHGVIYTPQVALVGFGGIEERPHAAGGMLGVRPTVYATLAADHRVSDGRTGGRFLGLIDHLLQAPEDL